MSERTRALAMLSMRLESDLQYRWTLGAGGRGEGIDFSLKRIAGVDCYGSPPLGGFSPRVIGFGLFSPASQRTLDAILHHCAGLRQECRIVVVDGAVDPAVARLLRRNSFEREEWMGAGHALETNVRDWKTWRRIVRALKQPDVTVERVVPASAALWAEVARLGFGMRGRWRLFARGGERLLRAHPRSVLGFLGRYQGHPAGVGAILLRRQAGLLFSGSVIRRFRGHGLQPALVAARVAHGLEHDARTFFSQTALGDASAHNLHDAGFRQFATFSFFLRKP